MRLRVRLQTHISGRALATVLVTAACIVLPGATLFGQRSGVNPPKVMTPAEFKAALTSLPADLRVAYGSDPHQFGELRVPDRPGPHPLVVLVHGGYFKLSNLGDLGPMGDVLKAEGIASSGPAAAGVGEAPIHFELASPHDPRAWPAVLAAIRSMVSTSADSLAQAQTSGPNHTIVTSEDVHWKALRPGAEMAVISGDPNTPGSPFVIRFRYRDKARIPPHWHPVDEHLSVLSGTFRIGMGDSGDEAATTALGVGAYALLPAKMVHYAWADANTTIQAHGIGPFSINYVNPAGDLDRRGRD